MKNSPKIEFRKALALAFVSVALLANSAEATKYKVDGSHTSVTFKVRHLFTDITGRFDSFEGTIEFDAANPNATKVSGAIQTASIDTANEKRDKHLRNKDFFDVENHPTITFESTEISDVDAVKKTGKIHGLLNMRGVEKPIILDVAFLGSAKDPWGNVRAGFTATTTINRKEFGVSWNETLDSGGLLVSEEVQIEINVEGMVVE